MHLGHTFLLGLVKTVLHCSRVGRTRATFKGTDDPIEMEVLFRALSKIGLGEGLLPGAKAQGLGRILCDGISLDDVEFPFRYGSAGVAF